MDLGDMMKQAKEIKQKMSGLKKELDAMRITGESGGGLVRVVLNGTMEVVELELEESFSKETKQVQETLLKSAMNAAVKNAQKEVERKQKDLLGLPGKLPF